ncbi:hypothetical protein N2J30_001868 [Vibrio vulnificus]|nr:hypothetical protein [Vibrio vulnificus]
MKALRDGDVHAVSVQLKSKLNINMLVNILRNNRSAIYSMISLAMRMATGPISILLVVKSLTIEQQAIYYAFITISSIQWVFELGVTTALVQYIGKEKNKIKIKAAVKLGTIFYIVMGVCAFLGMNLYASWLFADVDMNLWGGPFLAYASIIVVNIFNNICLIIEESQRNASGLYLKKLIASISYSMALLLSLYFGCGLYSLAFGQLAILGTYFITLRKSYSILYSSLKINNKEVLSVCRELRNFQSKVAVVWFVGYCYWNFYSVFIFKYVDTYISAQFGATNTILSALAFSATALLQTKRVEVGREISEGKVLKTQERFYFYTFISIIFYLLTSTAIFISIQYLPVSYGDRFLPIDIFFQYAALRLIIMISEMVLIYFRMFLEEPIYKLTLVNYIVTPLTCIPSYFFFGSEGLFILPLAIHVIFTFQYFKELKVFVNEKQSIC